MSRRDLWTDARSPYDVLGVEKSCDLHSLRRAYLAMIRACHPDNGGSEEHAKLVNAAYDYLKKHIKSHEKSGPSVRPSQQPSPSRGSEVDDWIREVDEMYRGTEECHGRKSKAESSYSCQDVSPGETTGTSSTEKQKESSPSKSEYKEREPANTSDERTFRRGNAVPKHMGHRLVDSVPLWVIIWLRCVYWFFSLIGGPSSQLVFSEVFLRYFAVLMATFMLMRCVKRRVSL